MKRALIVGGLLAVIGAAAWIWAGGRGGTLDAQPEVEASADGVVGSAACQSCHPKAYAAWHASAHADNMHRPSPETVVGDFNDTVYTYKNTRSRMFTKGGKYFMEYTGVEGVTETFPIAWTLGIIRHQAYLFEEADGRLQVLPTYWNVEENSWRDGVEGPVPGHGPDGQGALPITEREHWRNFGRTYNRSCMECHGSFGEKNYDLKGARYDSTFDPAVTCESCHGAGAPHIKAWRDMNGEGDPMRRLGRLDLEESIDVCTPCHARKRIYAEHAAPGDTFYDSYAPDVWNANGFFVDGRSATLNYRWVDFMQNRCSPNTERKLDCGYCHPPHDLHSVKEATVTESNAICTSCHLAHKTKLTAHTHHGAQSEGSRCVECHMPKMDLDLRMTVRDHTISSPLPALTRQYEVPNACNQCHKDETVAWAEGFVESWYGDAPGYTAYKATTLQRAEVLRQTFSKGSVPVAALAAWLDDATVNVVQRASAAQFLGQAFRDPAAEAALLRNINDPHPIVRYYVTRGLAPFQSPEALTAMRKALSDPVRTVRVSAYEGLFYVLPQIEQDTDPVVVKVRAEYRERRDVVRVDDPRDSSNLALWYFSKGDKKMAEAHLRRGVDLAPNIPRTRADLVQFLINMGQLDEAAEQVEALKKLAPQAPATLLARGLLSLARRRPADAIEPLQALVALSPNDPTAANALDMARRLAAQPAP